MLVLNAFRHQRTNHQEIYKIWRAQRECSTPFGINERTTVGGSDVADVHQVLNAFRHQRTNHIPPPSTSPTICCVLNAFRHQRTNHRQTLDRADDRPRVLNAFRHQRTNHFCRPASHQALIACAQRLSASTNEPPAKSKPKICIRRSVLNAFRHQRTNHAADSG